MFHLYNQVYKLENMNFTSTSSTIISMQVVECTCFVFLRLIFVQVNPVLFLLQVTQKVAETGPKEEQKRD